MRHAHLISSFALVAAVAIAGCRADEQVAQSDPASSRTSTYESTNLTLPSGTSVDVTLGSAVSSKTARLGDRWTGTLRTALVHEGRDLVPAGSPVTGTVTSVTPAHKGDRAMIDLGLTSIMVRDHNYKIPGGMESVIAGSTRARNLGAIGAATAAGAIVGHAIGGSDKSTVVGAVVGGGAATAVVSQTEGWQVVLKEGTPLTFTTNEAVAVRP